MRVLQVAMGISPASGGPTRSCKGLCRALSQVGVDTTLLVLRGHHEFDNPCGVKIVYGLENFDGVESYDLVHLQGLWDRQLHKVVCLCRDVKKPYVISVRGMLDPWALSVKKWKKRVAMLIYQRRDLNNAAAFHATAELEARNIRAQGLRQPIYIAPNGVDIPEELPFVGNGGTARQRIAIFLSRLHPGKGLLTLAEAWARVKPRGWIMRIVGPDTYGHKAEIIARLDSLGIVHMNVPARTSVVSCAGRQSGSDSRWEFVDMVDDEAKWLEYASSDLLVHPSVSENFGITIAEGLAANLPVICTKGAPWAELEHEKCGWWIDQGVDALAGALEQAMKLSDAERMAMGGAGRALVARKYLWPAVGWTMKRAYEELLA